MLVYIHVPFCRVRCNYCAFHSSPLGRRGHPRQAEILQHYTDTLLMELAAQADRFGGRTVESVFFGGGTPSLLPPSIVGTIIERIARHFSLHPEAEITLEANPESLRSQYEAAAFLATGVNRLSIGLQSLDDDALHMLGRPHRSRDSMQAVLSAREAGCANIGVDLMWGLPGQGVRQWLQTLKDVIRLEPEHISAYGLTLEEGTPLELECREGRLAMPPERDAGLMFSEGADFLESNGYLHYEISNYARMGFECRHNMGYWEGREYLGLGPTATSTMEGRRWTNPAGQRAWDAKVREGRTDENAEILTPRTRVLELIMLRLRTMRGLRLQGYRDLTGREFMKDNQRLVQALHENGLARLRDGHLRLTRKGMLVSNPILSNLFENVGAALDRAGTDTLPMPTPETFAEKDASPVIFGRAAGNRSGVRAAVFPGVNDAAGAKPGRGAVVAANLGGAPARGAAAPKPARKAAAAQAPAPKPATKPATAKPAPAPAQAPEEVPAPAQARRKPAPNPAVQAAPAPVPTGSAAGTPQARRKNPALAAPATPASPQDAAPPADGGAGQAVRNTPAGRAPAAKAPARKAAASADAPAAGLAAASAPRPAAQAPAPKPAQAPAQAPARRKAAPAGQADPAPVPAGSAAGTPQARRKAPAPAAPQEAVQAPAAAPARKAPARPAAPAQAPTGAPAGGARPQGAARPAGPKDGIPAAPQKRPAAKKQEGQDDGR